MKRVFLTVVTTTVLGCFGSAMVQARTADEKEGRIQQRKENQQGRIANGVKNGSLTPHETANLEHKESGLNKEIRSDRKANGGNLTNNEKKQVNRQQNRLSKQIYRDKHNSAVQPK